MRLIILLAITTTACVFYILHPLMRSKHAKMNEIGTVLLFLIPICTIFIYIFLGSPDIASKPALFETQGPRYEYRALIKQEMDIMHDLAAHPNDRDIMIALSTIRLQTARPDEAIDILEIALGSHPDDRLIKAELGAAHYAAAITALNAQQINAPYLNAQQGAPLSHANIEAHFKNALHYTPKNALFREELEKNYATFNAAMAQ